MLTAATITIDLRGRSRVFDSGAEAAGFVRGLAEGERRERAKLAIARHAVRDARLALGCALLQARRQVPHGEWREWLREVGLHRETARRAMRLAEALATPDGRLDTEAVERVRRLRRGELSADPRAAGVLDGDPDGLSLLGLEVLSGSRATPNGNRNDTNWWNLRGSPDGTPNEDRNDTARYYLGGSPDLGATRNGAAAASVQQTPGLGGGGESRRAPVAAEMGFGGCAPAGCGGPAGASARLPRGGRPDLPGQMAMDFEPVAARVHDVADRLLAAVRDGRLGGHAAAAAAEAAERFVREALISLSSPGAPPDGSVARLRACAPA